MSEKNIRAAIYLRQSKDREGNELAVDRQREDCVALCTAKGWTPTEYMDNDCSASNGSRPNYQRLLTDIRAGRVDAVVVWDLDRLHRRPIELEEFISLADEKHLALATVTGECDLSTDNGRLFARIKGAVARAEIERKSARQKRAAKQMAEKGTHWWSARPFGYVVREPVRDEQGRPMFTETGKPIYQPPSLDPMEAAAIREAYKSLIAGSSLRSIACDLDQAGFVTPRGNRWRTSSQVRQLLISPRNAGLRSYEGDEKGSEDLRDAAWPAIVPRDIWQGAVDILSEEGRLCGTSRARKHLLSNLAVCGLCGHTMGSGVSSGGARGKVIYTCKACNKISRNAEGLDDLVCEAVVQRLSKPNAVELTRPEQRDDLDQMRQQGRALRARLNALATEFADGDLTTSQLKIATNRITEKLDIIDTALRGAQATHVFDGVIGADDVRGAFLDLDLDRKRALIAELVTITVLPTVKGARFRREDVRLEFTEDTA